MGVSRSKALTPLKTRAETCAIQGLCIFSGQTVLCTLCLGYVLYETVKVRIIKLNRGTGHVSSMKKRQSRTLFFGSRLPFLLVSGLSYT